MDSSSSSSFPPSSLPSAPAPRSLATDVRGWFQQRSLFFKIAGVAILGLLLLIPLGMVRSTLSERHHRYREAVDEITQTWGGDQTVVGPVLVIPYTWTTVSKDVRYVDGRRREEVTEQVHGAEAYFLPEDLSVDGVIDPSLRKRSIYTAVVYSTKLRIKGRFAAPDFSFVTHKDAQPQWQHARVCFMIRDLRGTQSSLVMSWGGVGGVMGESIHLRPGSGVEGARSGVHAPVVAAAEAREFSLDVQLNGSGSLDFVPVGRQTSVKLASSWPDPSFSGAWLPTTRTVGAEGFEAEWRVSYYGRNFPESGTLTGKDDFGNWNDASFGVGLLQPVNVYRTTERAIKYGVLFVTLVFTVFFLFEVVCSLRLGALNYLLVGAALCMFYLGTLALAEFVAFGLAYALSAGAATLLIAFYSRHILRSGRRACLVGGMLGGVFGYLYFVLRMEDFSLLAGTGALFVMLAAVMYATRRLGTGQARVGQS